MEKLGQFLPEINTGALSRIAFSAAATAMGNKTLAAFYLEAIAGDKSRMVMNADQVIFTNGVNSQAPMTFVNGELTLMVAKINEITSGMLRSPDGKFVINLAEGYLRISD